ncbi:MAG: hypothetical protein WCK62_04470 [Actinomycetes bacterium]
MKFWLKNRALIAVVATSIIAIATPALAMGSGNPFVDAQTGLTYGVYEPTNTLGLAFSKISLLPCATGADSAIFATYTTGSKRVVVIEKAATAKCTNKALKAPKDAKVFASKLIPTKIFKATTITLWGSGGISVAQLKKFATGYLPADRNSVTQGAGGTSVLPPIMINPLTTSTVSVRLTNVVVLLVPDPANWSAVVADPTVATFTPGGNKGTWVANPGLQPLTVGSTTVVLSQSGKVVATILVTVTK